MLYVAELVTPEAPVVVDTCPLPQLVSRPADVISKPANKAAAHHDTYRRRNAAGRIRLPTKKAIKVRITNM
jgi:hypothetical protein